MKGGVSDKRRPPKGERADRERSSTHANPLACMLSSLPTPRECQQAVRAGNQIPRLGTAGEKGREKGRQQLKAQLHALLLLVTRVVTADARPYQARCRPEPPCPCTLR